MRQQEIVTYSDSLDDDRRRHYGSGVAEFVRDAEERRNYGGWFVHCVTAISSEELLVVYERNVEPSNG